MPKGKVTKRKKSKEILKNIGQTKLDELSKLAKEIRTISINIKSEMYQISELLVRAKKIIGHGNFKDWVKRNFDFSYQTAVNFMRVYKHCVGRPDIVKTISASILYMVASPDFPKDLREHIFMKAGKLKKIKNKDMRKIYRKFKEGKLDLHSPKIKSLFKMNNLEIADKGYSKQMDVQIAKIEKLKTAIASTTSKIEWPLHPSTNEVVFDGDKLKKFERLLNEIVKSVQGLRPGQRERNEKPKLRLVSNQ